MLPPALAIGWTIWRRHRWGLLLVLGWLLAGIAVATALPVQLLEPIVINVIVGVWTFSLIIGAWVYLNAVFSCGYDADLIARESCFPAALLRLPVRTGALAGWPMAYGAAAVWLLWLATTWFIWRRGQWPTEMAVPLWSPAMAAVAMTAWLQALFWLPFGLPWLRVVLWVMLMPVIGTAFENNMRSGASEGFLVAIFAGIAGVGWTLGYIGVKRARRGDVPNWDAILWPFRQRARRLPRGRQPYTSAAKAQGWFEWQRTGMVLPVGTSLLLPLLLSLLVASGHDLRDTLLISFSALLIPVFVAGLSGTTVSGRHRWVKDYYGVAPFTATLPMTAAGLVGAKLKAAAWSTLVAWAIVLVTVPVAVLATGHRQELAGWWQQMLDEHDPVKIGAGIVAAALFLLVWTWKRLADSLFLGLTGRNWVIQSTLVAGNVGFFGLCYMAALIYKNPDTHEAVLTVLPWLLTLLIVCRLLAAGWALRQVMRRGLLQARTLFRWLAGWLLLAVLLFGLLAWAVPAELVPRYYIAFAVVLVMPMARLAASPLVLAWNRHR